jgi:uncharacterized protein (TIGR01244 family)
MLSPVPAAGRYTTGRLAALVGIAAALTLNLAAAALAAAPEAPFGDKVSAAITNYNRATPFVGTSGRYGATAVAEVKELGFTTIVELRGPDEEGVAANAAAAKAAGLRYIAIPVTEKAPTEAQVQAFAQAVEDSANYPILVNCHSANRVGAMWALYRAQAGVPAEIAVEEGRTAGLTSREPAVRARLGLPPLSQ